MSSHHPRRHSDREEEAAAAALRHGHPPPPPPPHPHPHPHPPPPVHHPHAPHPMGAAGPPPGFFHPAAFNSGLAAAIAAAEYHKQRDGAAAAQVYAAARANGLGQPFIPGYPPPGFHHPAGPPPPPPPHPVRPLPPAVHDPSSPAPKRHSPAPAEPASAPAGDATPPDAASSRATSSAGASDAAASGAAGASKITHPLPIFNNGRPELPPPRWYDARVPLGVAEDKFYLSELQCVLRSEFVEAFGTEQYDLVQPVHGRNKPIALGQVGIRCQHCRHVSTVMGDKEGDKAAQNAISYPSFISGIYNACQQMYRLHFDACPHVPDELKKRVKTLKDSHASNRGGRKQYWQDSARRIGMVDTSFGIHFGRDPFDPLPLFGGWRGLANFGDEPYMDRGYSRGGSSSGGFGMDEPDEGLLSAGAMVQVEEVEMYPLVLPEDKGLISDYLYLALEQMMPCNLTEADRVGCYKSRRTGFPGLACKHCTGQAGCGRYFPASEASLSQTTTSQTVINHVRNCRRTPMEIREQLELMKRAKACPDYNKKGKKSSNDKPKHGGRKVFFHRLWCRIQRIPLPKVEKSSDTPEKEASSKEDGSKDGPEEEKSPPTGSTEKKKRGKSADLTGESSPPKKRRMSADDDRRGEFAETVEFDNVRNDAKHALPAPPRVAATPTTLSESHVLYEGRTRLARKDDPHWLSEADCFIRTELAEVFTAKEEDVEGFGDPNIGQVGIRCYYCAEHKKPVERTRCHVYFPRSVGTIQQAVADLQRRHLQLCKVIPEDVRESFRSMKGYGAKPKGDAVTQYWIDAARELGLHDSYEGKLGGVSFFRNPLDITPADKLDRERNAGTSAASPGDSTSSALIPLDEWDRCTDNMLLLLKQFRPCTFRASDRKSSRSRDRPIGFPGLVCVHCNSKHYFPITVKKLVDTVALMDTHIANCAHAPLDVKASLCYLQHRSLLQKAELSGQWKFSFLQGVFKRLHPEQQGTGGTASSPPTLTDRDVSTSTSTNDTKEPVVSNKVAVDALLEEAAASMAQNQGAEEEEQESDNAYTYAAEEQVAYYEDDETRALDRAEELRGMQGLIKAAALWLCERDAEYEAQNGRGRGFKRR